MTTTTKRKAKKKAARKPRKLAPGEVLGERADGKPVDAGLPPLERGEIDLGHHLIQTYDRTPLSDLQESKHNPRQRFDKAALHELAESIRAHGVLQPLLVRSVKGGRREVVAGARRLRAAKLAGLHDVPCIIRRLTDKESLELQVLENLQRQDLEPMEEARGFKVLHEQHGYAVEQIATRLGKSVGYVYGRMKLCALSTTAQKLLDQDKLDASTALLVARIPVPKLQDAAAKRIAGAPWGQPMRYRQALEFVRANYMLRLADAPFPTGDADLVQHAPACRDCPKRTGNQRELFGDVQGNDLCTDPSCYDSKVQAGWQRQKAEAEKKGQKVVEGSKAVNAGGYGSPFIDLDRSCEHDANRRKWATVLRGKIEDKDIVLAHHRGVTRRVVPKKVAQKAAKKAGVRFSAPRRESANSSMEAYKRQHRIRVQAAEAAVPKLVERAEALKDDKAFMIFLLEVVHVSEGIRKAAKRRGLKLSSGFDLMRKQHAQVAAMTAAQLRGLIVEAVAVDHVSGTYSGGFSGDWQRACRLVGLEMKAYLAAARKAATAKARPAKKKTAKKKAPRKGAKR